MADGIETALMAFAEKEVVSGSITCIAIAFTTKEGGSRLAVVSPDPEEDPVMAVRDAVNSCACSILMKAGAADLSAKVAAIMPPPTTTEIKNVGT